MARIVKRGDLVIVSAQADYGKPRPAIVIQLDWLKATDSILVALLTSTLVDAPLYRLQIEPSGTNGLKVTSQVMVDKILALPCEKCGRVIGRIDESALIALNHMLSVIVGIAD
jgi:mRNA interferase MazF